MTAIDLYNKAIACESSNRKIENFLHNLLQIAINEFSFSVKQTFVTGQDDMAVF